MTSHLLGNPFVVSFVATTAVLFAGGALTQIGPWYFGLSMPAWKPPNWAFGPVWTIIGICAALSAAYAWRATDDPGQRRMVLILFTINGVCNILWSLLFFRLRRPDWAMIEVAFLWASILAPMIALWPIHHTSSLLLAPYLLWVTIAACLNLSVVRRNAPFGLATNHPA